MLIAADDALESAADSGPLSRRSEVDKKVGKAIDLLCDFVKDPTSDPNIGGTVTGEMKMSDKSKFATTILHALKNDLHSNVKFPSVSLPLNADGPFLADGL